MNLKHWTVVGITALALVACGAPSSQDPTAAPATEATAPAAETSATAAAGNTSEAPANPDEVVAQVGDAILTRGVVYDRVTRIQAGIRAQAGDTVDPSQLPTDTDIEKSLVELFLDEKLVMTVAGERNVSISDAEIDNQITTISDNIAAQGGTLEEAITSQLGFASADVPEFRDLISSIVARQKIGETLVTTDTVEADLRTDLEAQGSEQVQKADVRHILVATEEEALQVIERLNNGESFEALAAELSTDPGSKDNGGLYEGIEPGQFVPEFDKAMFEDLEPGETTQTPVKTDYGYHVIRLESRTSGPRYTAEEIEQQIAEQLPYAVQQRQQEELQALIDAAREKAIAAGTLIEPTYPEPTPVAPGELPSDLAPAETPAADATVTP